MCLVIYINSIKKTATSAKALHPKKCLAMGVSSWLKVWLKKCNYIEHLLVFYIGELHLSKVLQSPIFRDFKGTYWGVTFKGTGELEKKLGANFFNLVKTFLFTQPSSNPYVMGVRGTFLTWLKLG